MKKKNNLKEKLLAYSLFLIAIITLLISIITFLEQGNRYITERHYDIYLNDVYKQLAEKDENFEKRRSISDFKYKMKYEDAYRNMVDEFEKINMNNINVVTYKITYFNKSTLIMSSIIFILSILLIYYIYISTIIPKTTITDELDAEISIIKKKIENKKLIKKLEDLEKNQ